MYHRPSYWCKYKGKWVNSGKRRSTLWIPVKAAAKGYNTFFNPVCFCKIFKECKEIFGNNSELNDPYLIICFWAKYFRRKVSENSCASTKTAWHGDELNASSNNLHDWKVKTPRSSNQICRDQKAVSKLNRHLFFYYLFDCILPLSYSIVRFFPNFPVFDPLFSLTFSFHT